MILVVSQSGTGYGKTDNHPNNEMAMLLVVSQSGNGNGKTDDHLKSENGNAISCESVRNWQWQDR